MGYDDGNVYTDIYDKPDGELKEIAKEFSEGCRELQECLLIMWENKLYTKACCRGEHDPYQGDRYTYSNAYIAAMEGIDFFSYLSKELITNDMIELSNEYNCQYIGIYGENKKELLMELINDISTGKKDHKEFLDKKIGKKISTENLIKNFIAEMRANNYAEEDITKVLPVAKEIFTMEYYWDKDNVTEEKIAKHREYHGKLINMIKEARDKNKKVL